MADLGVYVHFPWCRKLCPYCDFAVEVGEPPHEAYLDAILGELAARAAGFTGELASIYLGGGTPSLWRPACIARVIAAIRDQFGAPREVTIEANPTDCSPANLSAWRAAGIDRISIGVQSFDPRTLVVLGRDHRFGDGRAAIERTIAAGFATSADFILGVPAGRAPGPRTNTEGAPEEPRARSPRTPTEGAPEEPRARSPRIDLAEADHLSIYELTIEDRTAFGRRVRDGRLTPLDEDTLAALYVATHDQLIARGYEHYEISSYARPGRRAVHNCLYWRGAPYLGLGVGAASLQVAADGSATRSTNPRRAAAYLARPGAAAETVAVGVVEMAIDRAWLGLRTSDGVTEDSLAAAPGIVNWLVEERLAVRAAGRICPTLRGFLLADQIAARIVQCWEHGTMDVSSMKGSVRPT